MTFDHIFVNLWVQAVNEQLDGTNCEACDKPAEAHMLVTIRDMDIREVLVCHEHMLDPGPLLDYDRRRRPSVPPCPCECNSGGFCGGCGHAGCGGRR